MASSSSSYYVDAIAMQQQRQQQRQHHHRTSSDGNGNNNIISSSGSSGRSSVRDGRSLFRSSSVAVGGSGGGVTGGGAVARNSSVPRPRSSGPTGGAASSNSNVGGGQEASSSTSSRIASSSSITSAPSPLENYYYNNNDDSDNDDGDGDAATGSGAADLALSTGDDQEEEDMSCCCRCPICQRFSRSTAETFVLTTLTTQLVGSIIGEDLLQCPVCLETYDADRRRPTSLACGHTLCSVCIQKLIKIYKEQQERLIAEQQAAEALAAAAASDAAAASQSQHSSYYTFMFGNSASSHWSTVMNAYRRTSRRTVDDLGAWPALRHQMLKWSCYGAALGIAYALTQHIKGGVAAKLWGFERGVWIGTTAGLALSAMKYCPYSEFRYAPALVSSAALLAAVEGWFRCDFERSRSFFALPYDDLSRAQPCYPYVMSESTQDMNVMSSVISFGPISSEPEGSAASPGGDIIECSRSRIMDVTSRITSADFIPLWSWPWGPAGAVFKTTEPVYIPLVMRKSSAFLSALFAVFDALKAAHWTWNGVHSGPGLFVMAITSVLKGASDWLADMCRLCVPAVGAPINIAPDPAMIPGPNQCKMVYEPRAIALRGSPLMMIYVAPDSSFVCHPVNPLQIAVRCFFGSFFHYLSRHVINMSAYIIVAAIQHQNGPPFFEAVRRMIRVFKDKLKRNIKGCLMTSIAATVGCVLPFVLPKSLSFDPRVGAMVGASLVQFGVIDEFDTVL